LRLEVKLNIWWEKGKEEKKKRHLQFQLFFKGIIQIEDFNLIYFFPGQRLEIQTFTVSEIIVSRLTVLLAFIVFFFF